MQISMFQTGGCWRGLYNSGETYRINDLVRYGRLAYKANVDNLLGVAPDSGASWSKIIDQPVPEDLSASEAEEVSSTTTGDATGTRKYWFGQEWDLEKVGDRGVKLKKVYQNCNCNCNCACACDCVANQPNCGNCSYDAGDGLACNCACLFQSDCNYNSGNCNCSPNCADGNCYF